MNTKKGVGQLGMSFYRGYIRPVEIHHVIRVHIHWRNSCRSIVDEEKPTETRQTNASKKNHQNKKTTPNK